MKKYCTPKKPLPFFEYDRDLIPDLEIFCFPYTVNKTKKFNKDGKVYINTPIGNRSFGDGDIILRVSEANFIVLNKLDFETHFESICFSLGDLISHK